jgi:hypothetical protein
MIPVPQSQLLKIFTEPMRVNFEQVNLDGRASPEKFLAKVNQGYDNRTIAAFVDNLTDPHFFLVLGSVQTLVLDNPTCVIYIIYGDQPGRDRMDTLKEALLTAAAYAEKTKCGDIAVSSLTYLGARDIGALWESLEFDEQERIFTKLI